MGKIELVFGTIIVVFAICWFIAVTMNISLHHEKEPTRVEKCTNLCTSNGMEYQSWWGDGKIGSGLIKCLCIKNDVITEYLTEDI